MENRTAMAFNETNWTDSGCLLSGGILGTWYFNLVLSLEVSFGFIAALENVVLMISMWRLAVFHWNLRCLLGHLSACLLWFSVGHGFKAARLLSTSICGQSISARECKIRELFVSAMPSALIVYTLVSLCSERLYAALRYHTYDFGKSKKPWLAAALLTCSWTAGLGVTTHSVPKIPANRTVSVCESILSANAWDIGSVLIVNACLEVLSACLIMPAYFYTRYARADMAINRAVYDLSSRFQILQNTQLGAVVMLSIGLHLLCFIPNFIFLLLIFIGAPLAFETKVVFMHISYLWRIVYSLAHPLVAFYASVHLRRRLRRGVLGRAVENICCRFNGIDDEGKFVYFAGDGKTVTVRAGDRTQYETNAHFNQLAEMWASRKPEVEAAP